MPLIGLIGASNELPTGQSELSALYDRFLIRCFVDYVEANQLYQFFDITPPSYLLNHLSKDDIDQIHQKAANVVFPKEVQEAVCKIWADHNEAFKENSDETLSDRRFVKVINLMKISAATNDRNSVDFSDVFLLKDCLWNHPDNKTKVIDIIKTVLKQFDKPVAIASNDMADFNNQVTSSTPTKNQHKTHGLSGSGTQDDPILIENFQHLKRLEKPEIGQQGYYFKQTADIDCGVIVADWWVSNGKTIAPVLFTQDYFEHDLGWDFTTIWQWNDERNEPELRSYTQTTEPQSSSQNLSVNTGSLLAQQLQANIWL